MARGGGGGTLQKSIDSLNQSVLALQKAVDASNQAQAKAGAGGGGGGGSGGGGGGGGTQSFAQWLGLKKGGAGARALGGAGEALGEIGGVASSLGPAGSLAGSIASGLASGGPLGAGVAALTGVAGAGLQDLMNERRAGIRGEISAPLGADAETVQRYGMHARARASREGNVQGIVDDVSDLLGVTKIPSWVPFVGGNSVGSRQTINAARASDISWARGEGVDRSAQEDVYSRYAEIARITGKTPSEERLQREFERARRGEAAKERLHEMTAKLKHRSEGHAPEQRLLGA